MPSAHSTYVKGHVSARTRDGSSSLMPSSSEGARNPLLCRLHHQPINRFFAATVPGPPLRGVQSHASAFKQRTELQISWFDTIPRQSTLHNLVLISRSSTSQYRTKTQGFIYHIERRCRKKRPYVDRICRALSVTTTIIAFLALTMRLDEHEKRHPNLDRRRRTRSRPLSSTWPSDFVFAA